MTLSGSYANGFAPRDGQPLYATLWRGCVGAWSPCLGPTGLTLRDWSGSAKHGLLTDMNPQSDWVPSGSRYSLRFDGIDGHVVCPFVSITRGTCVSAWIKPATLSGYQIIVSQDANTPNRNWIVGHGGVTSGALIGVDWTPSLSYMESGATLVANAWQHIAFNRAISGMQFYINGIASGSAGAHSGSLAQFSQSTMIGSRNMAGVSSQWFSGEIDDVRIYDRSLQPQEIKLLASRRGIAYELAPVRYAGETAASYRRRLQAAQLIGGGMIG